MSGPMDYTRRVMAYGLDVGEMCREAVRAYEPYYRDTNMWGRLLTLPKWERVEVLISLYECLHFTAKVPDGEPLDRALWTVAHEISLFHENVLYFLMGDNTMNDINVHTVRVQLEDWAYAPTRAHDIDAGADLYTPEEFVLPAHCGVKINTGVHMEIPAGYAGFLKSKSGLNVNHGIISDGTIDAGYTGSIVVKLYNLSDVSYHFNAGDKVTQIVIQSVETPTFELVDKISGGERGDGGFGSTGNA